MRWATLLLAVVVVLVAAPACTDYEAGKEAFDQGDYATALKEWRALAAQGHAEAQYNLGVMYYRGYGVTKDNVQAYMWLNLAAVRGLETARTLRDKLVEIMPPAQLAEAQRLAREWKLKSE